MTKSDRTWVEVSRRALLSNFGQFQRFFHSQALIAPVVKANAYGHGNGLVVKTLNHSQVWGFCVAYDSEAIELRPLTDKPLLVLSAWQPINLPTLIRRRIQLVIWDRSAAQAAAQAAQRINRQAIVHLKIDTGTSRIGTRPEALAPLLNYLKRQRWLHLEGVFSHYADSESNSLRLARQQRADFIQAASQVSAPLVHIACTAASLRLPIPPTNLVRLGLGLYGLWPSPATRRADRVRLKPAMTWKTRVLQVKSVPAGTAIGYDRTYRVRRATTIAVLPVGYADGYDRRASNRSHVIISGRRCPIVGRVSMNLVMVDLGRRPVSAGTEVTLLGRGAEADVLAREWSTIGYEVVSRISPNIPRYAAA
ncbi:MAG: alanine racemase [Candidatus Kerfeldbacteria bacterium]|nr:alanine racemase [Candidatus Kerfeldbacteria bacterium]